MTHLLEYEEARKRIDEIHNKWFRDLWRLLKAKQSAKRAINRDICPDRFVNTLMLLSDVECDLDLEDLDLYENDHIVRINFICHNYQTRMEFVFERQEETVSFNLPTVWRDTLDSILDVLEYELEKIEEIM